MARLTPAQKRYLQVARDNGGKVRDYGNKPTARLLVGLGLLVDLGGHVSDGFPCRGGTYRLYALSAAGVMATEPRKPQGGE